MRRPSALAAATIAIATLLAAGVACTDDQRSGIVDAGTEAVVRNAAAGAGEAAFENEGYEVDGNLDCEATSSGGAERIRVTCSGTSVDGEQLEISGRANTGSADVGNAIRGSFEGTADGKTVFEQDCLGDAC